MTIPLRRYGTLLLYYLRPQWPKALLLAVLLLGSIGLQLLVPQILRFFIDTATSGGELRPLTVAALVFLAVGVGYQLLSAWATYVGADVGWTATNRMRADLALHCLRLDMAFHNARTPGELIERIDGDITALSTFFSVFTVRVFGSALLLVGILVLLWLENPLVGAALTAFALLVSVALGRSRELAVPATRSERESSARLFGFIEERLSGLGDIRANGGGLYTMRRFAEVTRDYFFRGRRAWMMRSLIWLLTMGLFTAGYLLTLSLGVHLYLAGAVTLGTSYLFFQYMMMLEAPIEQITQQLQELQKAAASIARVDELLRTPRSVEEGTRALPGGSLAVSFAGVSFAYGDENVLRDVSFRLAPGSVLGLLGRTGSGKSTLTRLLFRLYDPTAGAVRVGGVDLREASLESLRQRVGMVTQEVQLFHASLRDNLTFFDPKVSDARILAVLDDLGLRSWLDGLPDGLGTPLSAGGGGLSAGESQLLAFARVFLRDPGLVILDEPSSRLDPATERLLERATRKLLAGRTAIIIAHRLATVARADEIMVMAGGRVLEHGPRERLARDRRSYFHRLLHAQTEPPQAEPPQTEPLTEPRKELA
jgi:ABC-type multidrug transport system fused ATPase/permease subunit